MCNPIFSDDYEVLVDLIVEARRRAGISQRELARRLARSQSHVNMIERRQRRIEMQEFYRICKALECDPVSLFQRFVAGIELRQAA